MKISIIIPTYGMGRSEFFFERNLNSLVSQSFKDFEVVVTDNSADHLIDLICRRYKDLNIRYYRNPRRGMAINTNEGIKLAKGELIKILYQDDFLAHDDALKNIVEAFKGQWLATGCIHDNGCNKHYPYYNDNIHFGVNTIGSPSVITVKNDNPMLFDENLGWLLDCDYYKRMYEEFGEPELLNEVNVILGIGEHQQTEILADAVKNKEHEYLNEKYTSS